MRRHIVASCLLTFGMLMAGVGCSGSSSSNGSGGKTGGGGTQGGTGGMSGGTGGAGGARVFTKTGVCGQKGTATATATTYDGTEEKFLISDEGLGDVVCVVQFALKRVGAGQTGCTTCKWTQLLEYSNPMVVTDIDGACAKRELPLDAVGIAAIVGSRVNIGFAEEIDGAHSNARMEYSESKKTWEISSMATLDPATNTFGYEDRDGICRY